MLTHEAASTVEDAPARMAGVSTGGARFLHSYSALAGAMASLARLAKDGVSIQDLDVVQLMSDQNFFEKRLQNQQRNSSSKPGSVLASKSRESSRITGPTQLDLRKLAHLGRQPASHVATPLSRQSSRSRRARSASPASFRRHNVNQNGLGNTIGDSLPSATRSQVYLWDLRNILGHPLKAPPLLRRRSNSTPVSPMAAMTPSESYFPKANASTVPPSVYQEMGSLPHSLSSSLHNGTQSRTAQRRPTHSRPDEFPVEGTQITEIDAEDIPRFLGSVVDNEYYDSSDSDAQSEDSDEMDAAQLLEQTQRESMSPRVEAALDTLIWTIPFAFLYLMLDIMIQQQYAMHPTFLTEAGRLAQALPLLTAFVYYTAIRNRGSLVLQVFLFTAGTACGCGFLFTYTTSNHMIVTRRIAPLGTLWIYTVVRMELRFAVLSLAIIYGFVSYKQLSLFT